MLKLKNIIFFLGLLMIVVSCKEDDDQSTADFERGPMLENIGTNIIVPAYEDLKSSLTDLKQSFDSFEAAPTSSNLSALQSSFEIAYHTWQYSSVYNFGPALDYSLKGSMNTYPTDTSKIKDNVQQADFNLGTADKIDAIGFPSIDFLLYYENEIETLNAFTTDPYASDRMGYLGAVIDKMLNETTAVLNEWNSSYLTTFKEATGKDVGSSTGLLVNEMNKDFELIKHAEVGIPLGKQTLDITRPGYVQAYYSGLSKSLFNEHVTGIQSLFTGGNGEGFDDYLDAIEAEDGNGNALSTSINSQFSDILNISSTINMPFDEAVDQANSQMNDLYNAIQINITYLKTDLPSAIGVSITYQDNDGD